MSASRVFPMICAHRGSVSLVGSHSSSGSGGRSVSAISGLVSAGPEGRSDECAAPVGADGAAIADDRAWFDNRAGTDVAAVDHRSGSGDRSVLNDELVVREQVQHGVLDDLYV